MTRMETLTHPSPSPEALRALIAGGPSPEVAAQLMPWARLSRLQVDRVHFPAARPVQLMIRAESVDGQSDTLIGEWVGETAGALALAEASRLAKPRRGQSGTGAGKPVVADPAMGLLLRRRGFDAKLPGLRLLHDKGWAANRLGALGLDPASSVSLVAHRLGKRAVLRIVGRDGTHYARLRPVTSGSGKDAYDRHVALWSTLEGMPDLTIPRPLGFDPDLGLALFTALPGAAPVFQGLTGFRATRDIMRAVLALQHLPIEADPHRSADELAILQAWVDRTTEVFPDLARSLQCSLSRLTNDMIAAPALPPVPCHRDLHEGQILMEKDCVGLLDFDTLRLGDPALDVGNLQAHLVLATLRDGKSRRTFLNAMDLAVPQLSLKHIALWRRAALLRLAMIYAFSATAGEVIHGLIREAE